LDFFGTSVRCPYQTHLRTGYHVPAVRRRDRFYQKLEEQKAKAGAA
jgi:hypothetical protein